MPVRRPSLNFRLRPALIPSVWDILVFALVLGGLALVGVGGREAFEPLAAVRETPISLDPRVLPDYALRTTLRMLAAMGLSLAFTFAFGVIASKSRRAEMVLVPLLDIGQSVPVLGFLSFTITGFMALFPGQVLGVELAAIFAIFTSQVWNMAYSFYHSTKTIPRDLKDLSDSLRLGAWRRFWTLEAPYAAPGLIWNAMISMSGAWFFVVASESISVGQTTVSLPGVGSYVAMAIRQHDLAAVGWAVLTMLLVILAYDQLLFRPLVAWAEKFRTDAAPSDAPPPRSWVLDFIQRAELARRIFRPVGAFMSSLASVRLGRPLATPPRVAEVWASPAMDVVWYGALVVAAVWGAFRAYGYIGETVPLGEMARVLGLGFLTLTRVIVLILIASAIWVPIGVWIGLRPRWAEAAQPITQFLAAFPANLLFPVAVAAIVQFRLWPDVWLSPLMILGAQWYILFNVIAAARTFPTDLLEAAASLRIKGPTWWRKVALPWILPGYVTGATTAAGGAWNASIVAEVASWGDNRLSAHGLGAYIADATADGDLRRVTLGVAVMVVYVVLFNRLVWEPLFLFAAKRRRAD
jgi:NitT/TauT family transport system permease protein